DGSSGLMIAASGEIDLLNDGSGDFVCGPTGTANIGGRRGPNSRLPGSLMGRIGETGSPFFVGGRYQNMTAPTGKPYFQTVPPPFNNGQMPSGSFKAKISTGFFFGG